MARGRSALITGGTSGIGLGLATALRDLGWRVVIMGRRETHIAGVDQITTDFSSLRSLADALPLIGSDFDRIVLNAGVGSNSPGSGCRLISRDGYELRFQVNYLAHFALVAARQPHLMRNPNCRVVGVVSSRMSRPDVDDLMLKSTYNGLEAYSRSKGALFMLIRDIAEGVYGTPSGRASWVNPGSYVPTGMDRPGRPRLTPVHEAVQRVVSATLSEGGGCATTREPSGPDHLADRVHLRTRSIELIRRWIEVSSE